MKKVNSNIKRPQGIINNIITYICFKPIPLSSTKLTKLVYLVDVYHWRMFGRRLTNISFKHWLHGPWAPDISQALEQLYAEGILEEQKVRTIDGFLASIPRPKVPKTIIRLPNTAFEILDTVLKDWGSKDTNEIVQFIKNTLPFLNTAFGDEIDFSRIDSIKEYAKEKGISEEEAATLDIISDRTLLENIRQGEEDLKKGHVLTHKEVFES